MITDHSSLTAYHCYVIFLGFAGTDCEKTNSHEDTCVFDLWLRADEYWQKMLDAGLRGMLLFDSSDYVDPDEELVDYFYDLVDRDGFITDPAYWGEARESWRHGVQHRCWPDGKNVRQERLREKLQLRVIKTKEPRISPPRGICSPMKTGEVRGFERRVKAVFPDAQSATMETSGFNKGDSDSTWTE